MGRFGSAGCWTASPPLSPITTSDGTEPPPFAHSANLENNTNMITATVILAGLVAFTAWDSSSPR